MFWISIIFFFSGLSALVYQLLWMRHLGFIFGNTVYASATVLTAFMGGLAIGSHWFGRWAERIKDPLKAFAILEWIIAGYAVVLPTLFYVIRVIYRTAYQNLSDDLMFLTPLRFVLAVLVLLVPTIAMGGTLPVLIRGMAREEPNFGSRLGWLYGINTLGAVAGVFLSGFYLIPVVGLTMTNYLAAGTDLIAGVGAWILASRHRVPHTEFAEPKRAPFRWSAMPLNSRYAVVIATLCGFLSLALEVIWFRALILVFGSTTYSFTVMLGVFLLGIALGSLIIAPFLDRIKALLPLLAGTLVLVGVYTLWSMYRFDRGPEFLLHYLNARDFSWPAMNQARFFIAVSHLAVPALLFGISFTIATRMVRRDEASSSGATGMVYALNTVGAVGGSFAGGFLLLPNLGMEGSLLVIALTALVVGFGSLVMWGGAAPVRMLSGGVAVALVIYALMFPPGWNKSMLAAGAFFAPFNFIRDGEVAFRELIVGDRLLHYEEALAATVSVHIGDDEWKYFCVDGKTEADQSPRSMVLQRMIGHLPTLFHPNAKSGVNIGLGAGVSFGALGCHPLDHLEVVEINPAVQYATRVWGVLNHNILDNPRAVVTLNDGRNHLFSTPRTYDIITADPFEPVMAGAAHLYTVDYFQLAYNRLNPDGIMGQYLPLYEMSLDDYLTIVRSFVKVFPNTALFFTGFDTILIGFKGDVQLNADVLRRNFEVPEVKASLADIGFTRPEMLLGMFVSDLSKHPEFAGSGPLNTDEFPIIEYNTPRSALRYTTDENQAALLANFTPIPEAWLVGLDESAADRLQAEHEAVRLMLEASVMRARGDTENAFITLAAALEISPENPVVKNEMVAMLVVSAQNLRRAGDRDEAARQFQSALQLDPDDFWSLYYLVELAMQAGHVEFAGQVLEHAMERYPDSPLMLGLRGKYLFSLGDQAQAFEHMKLAVHGQPGSRLLWADLHRMATVAGDGILQTFAQQNLDRINAFIAAGRR
ncbi:MAG TPA: fused MFS/spermidine synthase [Kiritimatiellia bacterium]|nr:fused MFS/spermidine synthase [Kiritimatiellia bacterium]HMO98709.1 fused MFS/spermidine synthase [Kiritimatiellia bacterium]HMP97868.1 fused MFS/spermidine synthase [Kiritimatiellia bacterium]